MGKTYEFKGALGSKFIVEVKDDGTVVEKWIDSNGKVLSEKTYSSIKEYNRENPWIAIPDSPVSQVEKEEKKKHPMSIDHSLVNSSRKKRRKTSSSSSSSSRKPDKSRMIETEYTYVSARVYYDPETGHYYADTNKGLLDLGKNYPEKIVKSTSGPRRKEEEERLERHYTKIISHLVNQTAEEIKKSFVEGKDWKVHIEDFKKKINKLELLDESAKKELVKELETFGKKLETLGKISEKIKEFKPPEIKKEWLIKYGEKTAIIFDKWQKELTRKEKIFFKEIANELRKNGFSEKEIEAILGELKKQFEEYNRKLARNVADFLTKWSKQYKENYSLDWKEVLSSAVSRFLESFDPSKPLGLLNIGLTVASFAIPVLAGARVALVARTVGEALASSLLGTIAGRTVQGVLAHETKNLDLANIAGLVTDFTVSMIGVNNAVRKFKKLFKKIGGEVNVFESKNIKNIQEVELNSIKDNFIKKLADEFKLNNRLIKIEGDFANMAELLNNKLENIEGMLIKAGRTSLGKTIKEAIYYLGKQEGKYETYIDPVKKIAITFIKDKKGKKFAQIVKIGPKTLDVRVYDLNVKKPKLLAFLRLTKQGNRVLKIKLGKDIEFGEKVIAEIKKGEKIKRLIKPLLQEVDKEGIVKLTKFLGMEEKFENDVKAFVNVLQNIKKTVKKTKELDDLIIEIGKQDEKVSRLLLKFNKETNKWEVAGGGVQRAIEKPFSNEKALVVIKSRRTLKNLLEYLEVPTLGKYLSELDKILQKLGIVPRILLTLPVSKVINLALKSKTLKPQIREKIITPLENILNKVLGPKAKVKIKINTKRLPELLEETQNFKITEKTSPGNKVVLQTKTIELVLPQNPVKVIPKLALPLVNLVLRIDEKKLPKIKLPFKIKNKKGKKKEITVKDLPKYAPSLASLVYGIVKVIDPKKAKELKKKVWSGFEIRPIVIVKRK